VRLAVAFIAVALAAIAVLTVVTLAAARGGVAELVERQQQATLERVAALAGQAYERAAGWDGADLQSAVALAMADGASLAVLGLDGQPVDLGPMAEMPGMMRRMHGPATVALGPPAEHDVVADGQPVGVVELRFPADGAGGAEVQLRGALTRNVLVAAAVAGLLALVAAGLVAARLTLPLTRLTGTVEAVAAGDRSIRSGGADAPGELGTLSRAVDRMADTLERQEQLRRGLVADVAHELRTPLAIALGECDALIDGVVEASPERLVSIREEIVRLTRLVEDLETLASAQSAGLQLMIEPVDLAELVADLLAVRAPRLADAAVKLDAALGPAPVSGDPLRLGQIFTNLLTNAVKFTPTGGRIGIVTQADGGFATLSVTDDGPGIDADELEHLFERFWQGRAAAGKGGSGIGLAVARELARAHGGLVEATNVDGRGARFTLRLPRRDVSR
jgi:two-component system, OmpR family, sensor histidine kinase BaeS